MNRREFLSLSAAALVAPRAPAIVIQDGDRPGMPCGVATGDVTDGQAIVWSRSDRPARLIVEYSTTPSFADTRRVVGPAALEATDFTARVDLVGCRPGSASRIARSFRISPICGASASRSSGSFQTPARIVAAGRGGRGGTAPAARDVSFVFSGDCVGQGWGIDLSRGGMRLYEAMRKLQPDVFIHLGDTIYADQPLKPEVDARRRIDLAEPRHRSEVEAGADAGRFPGLPSLQPPGRAHAALQRRGVAGGALGRSRGARQLVADRSGWRQIAPSDEKSVALLAARAKRAFLEYLPLRINPIESERIYRAWRHGPALEIFALDMRSYRGANSANRQTRQSEETAILGDAQIEWLERALAASTATWKLIACDMPLGLVVPDAGGRVRGGGEPRPRRAARPRARDRGAAEVHQGPRDPQRRLDHR